MQQIECIQIETQLGLLIVQIVVNCTNTILELCCVYHVKQVTAFNLMDYYHQHGFLVLILPTN